MIQQNLHTHSVWDDGQDAPEDMVRAAIAAGLSSIGFSGHSPLPIPNKWTIAPERLAGYRAEIRRLKKAYAGQIDVYCGLEWDLLSAPPPETFDYVIGSIHHIPTADCIINVDNSPEETERYLGAYFGGDPDAAAETYFSQYAALAAVETVDIVGHFDLITKFDELCGFFHSNSPAYRAAAEKALKTLVDADKIFEINTGAISRGFRATPYPSAELLSVIQKRGGRITVTSDAHSASGIVCSFDAAARLARDCGFREIWRLDGTKFVAESL